MAAVYVFLVFTALLSGSSGAQAQEVDSFPKEALRVERRLARQTNVRNFRRDVEAFKRSKKREARAFLQERAREIRLFRSGSFARKASLRLALDLNHDGRIVREELLSGRGLIKSLRKEDRDLWLSLREKHRLMFLAFREGKKKEYQEIRKRFDQGALPQQTLSG